MSMTRAIRSISLLTGFLAICGLPSLANGQLLYSVNLGDGPTNLGTLNDGDTFTVSDVNGISFCCQISAGSDFTGFISLINPVNVGGGGTLTAASRGLVSPGVGRVSVADSRRCLISDADRVSFEVQMTTASANNVVVSCEDTTLYGGYNTSVTDFNFLQLTNTQVLSALNDITAEVSISDVVNGATPVNREEITVPSARRVDFDIHSRTTNPSFGTVKVRHDGVPGGVAAEVGQYRIVTTTPLDFEPSVVTPLKTR